MKKKNIAGMIGAIMSVVVLSGCSNIQLNYDIDGNTVSEETKETAIEASTAEVEKEDAEATSKSSVEDKVANESESEDVSVDVSNDISGYDSAEMMDGEALTEDELKSFQDYFNQADNYILTIPNYRTPDMINVDGVTADADRPEIVCLEGVKKDNMIQVVVSYSESTRYKRRVTLVETGDSDQPYQFYSCRQLWEEAMDKIIEAPVYGTDETETCGVITKYDAWTTEIDIIEDNAVSSIVSLSPYVGAENVASDEVKEIAFCDIDNDGENNLIAICVYGNETRAILCGGHRDQNGIMKYTEWKEGYSIWLGEKVSDLTADNVINYILEHQDELNNI